MMLLKLFLQGIHPKRILQNVDFEGNVVWFLVIEVDFIFCECFFRQKDSTASDTKSVVV